MKKSLLLILLVLSLVLSPLSWAGSSDPVLEGKSATDINIDGGAIDNTPVGDSTPETGAFTTLSTTGNVTVGSGGDPADAGAIRLKNADKVVWEASPAGTDVEGIAVDSSEVVQIGAAGASGVTITPALTGSTGTFTGTLSGELGVTLDTSATIDLSTASNARGAMRVNNDNDVIDYTLPPAEAGLNICFYSRYAAVMTIDCDDGADTIILRGTALTAGNAIDSAGGAGDFVCLLCIDATYWLTLGMSGPFIDGGVD